MWSSVTAEDNDADDVMVGDSRSLTACTVILSVHGLGVLPAFCRCPGAADKDASVSSSLTWPAALSKVQ